MKILLALCLLCVSTIGQASSLEQLFPTKERLRLSLWFEGIDLKRSVTTEKKLELKTLPEELARPLRTL